MLAITHELSHQNKMLQENAHDPQQQETLLFINEQEEYIDPQPIYAEIWNALVPKNFKLTSLADFDGKSDPQEHIIDINTHMDFIGATDSLECKLMPGTLKEATL